MIKPFDIVVSTYSDTDGKERVGVFLIISSEELDNQCNNKFNYLACKITSQSTTATNSRYALAIDRKYHEFLDKDSFVLFDKLHTLDYGQITKILGELSVKQRLKAFKTFKRYLCNVENQFIKFM